MFWHEGNILQASRKSLDFEENTARLATKKVFQHADGKFIDEETGNYIAVKKAQYHGKERDIMVAYDEKEGKVEIITIHPLKERQKENRIKSGGGGNLNEGPKGIL